MNPRKMRPFAEAHKLIESKKYDYGNAIAHLQGLYFIQAIGACFGKEKYPEKPYELNTTETVKEEKRELTEEEKREQTEQLFLRLKIMACNFSNSK